MLTQPPMVSPEVRAAVIAAYAEATGVDTQQATAGFDGDPLVAFDSIIGLELMVAVEARLGIEIPEVEETRGANFRSIAAFARMVDGYRRAAPGGER